jgi:DNA polymerase III alpha subunit
MAVALLIAVALPPLVSALYVRPNEISLQRPYIETHIHATRSAFGLEQRVKEIEFKAHQDAPIDIAGNQPLLDNVRLWDWRALQDTLSAIRLKTSVAQAGYALHPNGERHLRPLETLRRVYPTAWLAETLTIAERCRFSLDSLRYEYPEEIVPTGESTTSYLRRLTEEGFARRLPVESTPEDKRAKVRKLIEHELAIIAEARYEPFFLTAYDVVKFAREQGNSVLLRLRRQFGGLLLPRHQPARSRAWKCRSSASFRRVTSCLISTSTSSISGARK